MKRSLALVALILAGGCSLLKGGPEAGELTFNLTTPNSDDGAVQFTVIAAAGDSITGLSAACSGCKLFQARVTGTQYKGVVTGTIAAGALFRASVSNINDKSAFTATVNDAASRTFQQRATGMTLAAQ